MAGGKFLTLEQLTEIGLERLRLPVPMVKLQVIRAVARALDNKATRAATWGALLRWVATLDLESEVLEALSIVLVARETQMLSAGELQRSISQPSILSDHFLSLAFSAPVLVSTWENQHSGQCPPLYPLAEMEHELSKSHIVPPILASKLRGLERRTKLPFMRQWAYEFDRLLAKCSACSEGHLGFFSGDLGRDGTGQFISSRGHIARSAFLRVFALAVDRWDMPEGAALDQAMFATPVDFGLLRMPPDDPPPWAPTALNLAGNSYDAYLDVVKEMLVRCDGAASRFLVHYDGPLHRATRFQADLEIITVNCCGSHVAEEAFRMHEWLPGHAFIRRDDTNNFDLPPWQVDQIFPTNAGSGLRPCLLPSLSKHVGYVHADLVLRTPYLPVSHVPAYHLVAFPRAGGADITFENKTIGELHYWNFQWQPMRHKGFGAHCAVGVTIDKEMASKLFTVADGATIRCWRVRAWSRANDYGEWNEQIHFGTLD